MDVQLVHAIPGRIRLKVAGLGEHPEFGAELRQRLSGLPGLREVAVRPGSHSVIVRYDATDADHMVRQVEASLGGFRPIESTANTEANGQAAATIAAAFRRADRRVEQSTGLGLKLLVPVVLATLAALALIVAAIRRRKTPLPSWYDLLWFAFNTFIILNLPFSDQEDEV